jgi:hypothetical protein
MPRPVTMAVAAVIVVAAVGWVALRSPHVRYDESDSVAATPPSPLTMTPAANGAAPDCPVVTATLRADLDGDGCDDALDFTAGVLSSAAGRFRVGDPGDHVATGRWACHPPATLALLRPDGTLFVADAWATPGQQVVLRSVGTVADATDISVADENGDGCDELVVHRRNGATATLHPGGTP